jgi:hypothetical protein
MNLHEIVSGAINSINPFQTITITPRSSYTVNEYGEATPNEGASYQIQAQIQPLTSEDIKFINQYNESTVYKAFWVSANTFGLNRPMARGGDKVVWGSQIYYVTSMPEDWYETSGWSHFIGALQLTPESEENNANT